MSLIDKIKNFGKAKLVAGSLAAALIATTAIKDNVHFGSTTLNNPHENHYVWGIFPTTTIRGGSSNGNFYTLGLVYGGNDVEGNLEGSVNSVGLVGASNNLKERSSSQNMNAYGLFGGVNTLGEGSTNSGSMGSYGLILASNLLGERSVSHDLSAYALFIGSSDFCSGSRAEGDLEVRGIFSWGHDGFSFGGYSEKNASFVKSEEVESKED